MKNGKKILWFRLELFIQQPHIIWVNLNQISCIFLYLIFLQRMTTYFRTFCTNTSSEHFKNGTMLCCILHRWGKIKHFVIPSQLCNLRLQSPKWVRVNQSICFPPNGNDFPLPPPPPPNYTFCVEPAGGGGGSRKRKTFGGKRMRWFTLTYQIQLVVQTRNILQSSIDD
jgi:hypothetical protein